MYLISYLGNRGFKRENLKRDGELLYRNGYMVLCILGLVVHNFFYSILVCLLSLYCCLYVPQSFENHLQYFHDVQGDSSFGGYLVSIDRNDACIFI